MEVAETGGRVGVGMGVKLERMSRVWVENLSRSCNESSMAHSDQQPHHRNMHNLVQMSAVLMQAGEAGRDAVFRNGSR